MLVLLMRMLIFFEGPMPHPSLRYLAERTHKVRGATTYLQIGRHHRGPSCTWFSVVGFRLSHRPWYDQCSDRALPPLLQGVSALHGAVNEGFQVLGLPIRLPEVSLYCGY